jgi:hypothetical protein
MMSASADVTDIAAELRGVTKRFGAAEAVALFLVLTGTGFRRDEGKTYG